MVQDQTLPIDFSTAATQAVIPAVAGKRILVFGVWLVNGVATAQTVQFKSGANNLTGVMSLPSAVGGTLPLSSGSDDVAVFFTDVGAALSMVQSAGTQVGGVVAFKYL